MNDKFSLKGHLFKRDEESLCPWPFKQYICINCNLKIKTRKKPDGSSKPIPWISCEDFMNQNIIKEIIE